VGKQTKDEVRGRARGICEYCRVAEAFCPQAHSVEHIVPRLRHGDDSPENLALSCQGCNNHKHTKTHGIDALSGELVPLFHPRRMDWREHFAWSDDYSEIVPLTPIGRVTVRELCLNRIGLRNLRRVLFGMGEHPPKTAADPDA
jgi:hypothetical protein